MKAQFKALIVDDERLARRELASRLADYPDIRVVGESNGVQNALEKIQELKPDLIFLDIQLAGESGFDLLEAIEDRIEVIFVTAFDTFAVRAFEVNALDYLLKPIHPDRLKQAIERLAGIGKKMRAGIKTLEYDDQIYLTMDGKPRFLEVNQIACICAAGDYSEIVTADTEKTLILKPLKEWEQQLPKKQFIRIHRSTIINLDYVASIEPSFNSSNRVYLRHIQRPFIMSRRYEAKIKGELSRIKKPE